MLLFNAIFVTILSVYMIVLFAFLVANRMLIKGLMLNAGLGILLLILLKILSVFFEIKVFINIVSVYTAIIFGIIGVVFNLLINYVVF